MIPIKDNIPNDRFPLVTVSLVLANVVVYVLTCVHGGSLISGPDTHELVRWGVSADQLTHSTAHTWATAFTSMFIHASIIQLAGNMLFLWIFGNSVEDSMGPGRFVGFYLVGGLVALALQVAIAPSSETTTVGPAGAIAAVIGGYVALYPRGRVLTLVLIILFFTVIELPALVMVGLWFVMQGAFALAGLQGGIAYLAQLGGFAFGLVAIRVLATRRKPTPPTAAAYR